MPYAAGDIINFDYTGAVQTVKLPPGRYKLEVWGAQGGSYGSTALGGNGGYSIGELSIDVETQFFVYVGGQGAYSTTSGSFVSGGFNGGGAAGYIYGGSGGGGTDIRIGQDSLYARVIVAGGGGGAWGYSNYNGGVGGGESGGQGTGYSSSYLAGAGTQTSGGTGNGYSSSYYGSDGAFGVGGNGSTTSSSYNRSSGGGGGWYGGGGSGYRSSSSYYYRGGGGAGGGSGFAWAGSNAPDGYLLGTEYQLTNAQTIDGSTSFDGPDGTAETGHSGDGFARITVLEIYPQAPETPGNFRQTGKTYYEIGLAWDAVSDATGYKLYKDGTLLSAQTGTTYTDSGMLPAESHVYTLTAYNDEGESDPATLTAETEFAYYVVQPVIHSASFSVNPADMNQNTVLSVELTDEFKILEPDFFYSGEIYSGEV